MQVKINDVNIEKWFLIWSNGGSCINNRVLFYVKDNWCLTGIFLSPMRESVITGECPDTVKITETLTSIFFESTFNIPKSLLQHWGNHGLLGERECVCCSPRLWMNRSSERVRLKESCPMLLSAIRSDQMCPSTRWW